MGARGWAMTPAERALLLALASVELGEATHDAVRKARELVLAEKNRKRIDGE